VAAVKAVATPEIGDGLARAQASVGGSEQAFTAQGHGL
jgi:hypothetical protein